MTKNSSWTHQLFWEKWNSDKTNLQFLDPILGEVWRCHPPGTLYLSVIFLCRSCICFWCNSKCTNAKIKFGCLNIIRAPCVHHLQQTVPFSMLSYTSISPKSEKTHITRHSLPHLNCPLPIFAHGFRSPGSNRIGDDDAIRMDNVGPRLHKSLVVQNVFLFWQVRDGGLKLNTSNTCELKHPHEILGYL